MNRQEIFGLPVDLGATAEAVLRGVGSRPLLLTYINPLAWSVARKQPDYVSHLWQMDLVVCDGVGIKAAAKRFCQAEVAILTPDMSGIGGMILNMWARAGTSVCLVGGAPDMLSKARQSIAEQFSGLDIAGAFAGFGDGPIEAREYILDSQPQAIMVGMGMGLQEAFLLDLRSSGWRGVGVCVGAFFDRLAMPEIDYPEWSKKYNVRFLGNLARRPGYYFRRYTIDYMPFMRHYSRHLLGLGRSPRR